MTLLRPLILFLLRLFYRFDASALETMRANGKTLIVANHVSLLDGLLLMVALPFSATAVVNTIVARHPLYRHLLRHVKHLTVSPNNPMAMKQVIKLVEAGEPVIIFPEGRITLTGRLMKIYDGTAFIAARTNADVHVVHISGAEQSRFGYIKGLYKSPKRIVLHAMGPVKINVDPHMSAKLRRKEAGIQMTKVLQLSYVSAREARTIPQAFLAAMGKFGSARPMLEDVRVYDNPSVPAMTYKAVLTAALGVKALTAPITSKGEYVGVLMPNASPTVGLILGLLWGARVPCMLNYTAGSDGISSACLAAGIRTIFTSRNFITKGNLQPLIDGLPKHLTIVYAEDLRVGLTLGIKLGIAWERLFANASLPKARPGDPAVVLFTSGSEGKPKGVVHTHASILANVNQIDAVADFTPKDKFLVALPLFHSFGFTAGAILPLVSGHSAFFYPSPLHYRNIPEVVYDRQCTTIFGTSTFLGNYARFAHNYDFAHVRTVVAGAEKLNPAVKQIWSDRFGVRILEGYGVTECAPVISVNTRMVSHPGSVGALMPGMEMKLEAVPGIDEGGRLIVRGPNVMAGYVKVDNPGVLEPTSHDGQAGWYDTGDIVKIENGCIVIQGRAKRFAKIAGEMVSLEVAEKVANTASANATHAVVSIPNAAKGEALVLFTTDQEIGVAALSAAARSLGIPELAVAKSIRPVDAIPLLGTGKTDYVRLNAMAQGQQ